MTVPIGNLATLTDTGGTTTYTWNSRDQLTNLAGPGLTASFQYDAVRKRKQKSKGKSQNAKVENSRNGMGLFSPHLRQYS